MHLQNKIATVSNVIVFPGFANSLSLENIKDISLEKFQGPLVVCSVLTTVLCLL